MKKSKKTEQEWRQLLAKCKARPKGIRIPDWCEQQGISLETYKYWQRKLRDKAAKSSDLGSNFVSLPMPVSIQKGNHSQSEISIQYKEFKIIVTENSSQELLARLLAVVRASC